MNGIKMSDCRFYVNPEARTVVCVVPHTENMVINFIKDHCRWGDINLWYSIEPKLTQALWMPNSFVGKAVCAKEDEWDEETGRLIAFSRAKDKCYKSFFKRANTFIQAIDNRMNMAMDIFNDFGMKLQQKQEALQTRIDEQVK